MKRSIDQDHVAQAVAKMKKYNNSLSHPYVQGDEFYLAEWAIASSSVDLAFWENVTIAELWLSAAEVLVPEKTS